MTSSLLYIHPSGWTDADLVRHLWPFRLIQPEWVSSPPQYDYLCWTQAETLARLGVVFLGRLGSTAWVIEGVTKAKVWNLDFIGYFADSHLALVNGARWSPPPVPEKVEGASSPQATGAGSVVRAVLAPAATPPHPPVMPSPK